MPGLLRGIARTAVIAGTATAVSNRVSRRQSGRWAQQDDEAYAQQENENEDDAGPEDMSAKLAQLEQLAQLRDQGVLTDAEFEQQKARILGP